MKILFKAQNTIFRNAKKLTYYALFAFIFSASAHATQDYDDYIDDEIVDDFSWQDGASTGKRYKFKFSGDKDISSIATADWFNSGFELYRVLDEKYMHTNSNVVIRGVSYLTKYLFAQYAVTAQHEFGGHGGRLREFDVHVGSYEVNFDGSGATSFSSADYNKLSIHEQAAVSTGGIESTFIMGQKVSDRFFEENMIYPSNAILYIAAMTDQPFYIFNTKRKGNGPGHDIQSYINKMNIIYGKGYLDREKIRSYAYLDLFDPLLVASAYSYIFGRSITVPMIDFGSFEYLPGLRSTLAPYGLERNLVNHIRYDGKYIRLTLGHGKNKKFDSYYLNAMGTNLHQIKNFKIGGEIGLWRQPKLFGAKPINSGSQFGALGEITGSVMVFNSAVFHLAGGYKSQGFVPGRPLRSSGMLRAGIELQM